LDQALSVLLPRAWVALVVGEDLGDKNHRPAGKQTKVAPRAMHLKKKNEWHNDKLSSYFISGTSHGH